MLQKTGWSSGSHHTKPPPSKKECSSKNCSSNHPCCYWLVRHSSKCPKQQRRPLPSILSVSSSMVLCYRPVNFSVTSAPSLWGEYVVSPPSHSGLYTVCNYPYTPPHSGTCQGSVHYHPTHSFIMPGIERQGGTVNKCKVRDLEIICSR